MRALLRRNTAETVLPWPRTPYTRSGHIKRKAQHIGIAKAPVPILGEG